MTDPEILQYVKDHPSRKVKIAFADIDGVLRGKYVSAEKFLSVAASGLGFCDVIFGWDSNDLAYDHGGFTGWHTGYPDARARIDLSTFRKVPWENDVPFFLGDMVDAAGAPLYVCPRQLLKKVLEDAGTAGFVPIVAQEFEWYNFSETPQTLQEKRFSGLTPLTPGMFGYSLLRSSLNHGFFSDLFDLLGRFGVPVEGIHTETGPGTYEAAVVYAGMLEAADRAVLFKTAVKEIAYRHDVIATFMAKFSEHLPGCGGHIHQSLWNREMTDNLFHDPADELGLSALMRHYIAGQLYCLPFILPLFAPVINSYKRLVEGAWAPTTLTWGIDNRTVALRALPSGPAACRLETRVTGADVNPYLAISAAVASGLYGIRNKLPLTREPCTGNGYRDFSQGTLPATLEEATREMKKSPVAAELFGEKFTAHFIQTREWEWRQHLKPVTDWELRRYFEII